MLSVVGRGSSLWSVVKASLVQILKFELRRGMGVSYVAFDFISKFVRYTQSMY